VAIWRADCRVGRNAVHLLYVDLISEEGIYENSVVEEGNIWLLP
jgi:hypothetical protein